MEITKTTTMFNTKRIEALSDMIGRHIDNLLNLEARVSKIERKEIPNIIHCSTCKCLIRKEDAIRGKSEVVRKDMAISESCGDKKYGTFIEELVTPYYCHNKDCKPKK